ncbi:hypothetical protein [Epilithonimonas hominis]|uniref:nSTAND3 domain-containing NTPase n=1 Tax=Epilithonimonas hominis TaxID=420404 RepID=UPI002896A882|nr:hypothetical protein [Epilithonimonas hominis]
MNTITQIENALKAINQASFQTLINHLLHLEGNKFIGSPGAVVGKEKTSKGTPDSFFVNGDNYIFVECTTKERIGESKSFFDKLSKDIDHCFNENETSINKDKIEKVFLACIEKVSPEEFKSLNEKVKSFNSNATFEILTIQNLPMRIYDIPKLAEEYLNIQMIKGDIYTLEQFLLKTDKGLQPSLTNEFIGREEELKDSINVLKTTDILFLSGAAGVGKSKLGVKILEELSKEDYIPIVIQSSGVSLWDDYQHLFMPGKNHIILFDDANKSVNNLVYLLNRLESSQSYTAKVIITSRDYVKKQVSHTLENYTHKELNIKEFKDEEIEKIIVAVLPGLKHYQDIKRKIIELAKGNARVALMATNSVVPEAETNYLDSPVLLYEKYFKKISEDIGIFSNPIILKSLAIVSFYGVLDRNNKKLKDVLLSKFGIDWNDLWSAIMELHNNEILDVYSEEVVKVSDQVLATYAFYKCFTDEKSAVINYADWILAFIEKYSYRISATLIDINNTFAYSHVKDLVSPHLKEVIQQLKSDKEFYEFYNLFWFYKGRDCLLYLKKWINGLSQEEYPEKFEFSYVHNDHTKATKHFELLRNFWNHPNELLVPSLELTLKMVAKNPSRIPEVLKFVNDYFSYRVEDLENGYLRQNILFDVLLNEKLTDVEKLIANGIFLNISEKLLGWEFTEFGSTKGSAFTILNFRLFKSDSLLALRNRILNKAYELYDVGNEQSQKLLNKIVRPGGDIDKTIFAEELSIYENWISNKLDNNQYTHCKFVSILAKHLTDAGINFPDCWNEFIESDIIKLSKFIKPSWEYKQNKSIEACEKEKRQEFEKFVNENDWNKLEKFLLNVDELYHQQKDSDAWHIEGAVTDLYSTIARKSKNEIENALRLFFSGKVQYPLRAYIMNVLMDENIMTANELLNLMNEYDFKGKPYWESVLVTMIPDEQVNESFLNILIQVFQSKNEYLYIHRMLDYLKYDNVFSEYKSDKPKLENHNIITYLTSIILEKPCKTTRDFGLHFCEECASYFTCHTQLLKDSFWSQYEIDPHFDYRGKELKAILDIDHNFLNDSLKNGKIGLSYSSKIRLENINTNALWEYEEYGEIIEDLLLTAIEKEQYSFLIEEDIYSIFRHTSAEENATEKMENLILHLIRKHNDNEKVLLILSEVVYHNFNTWFLDYFKEFLLVNKNIEVTKRINFGRSESWSGSRVPIIQKKIEFYQDIIKMINTLPDILDYSEHIDYFEQKIIWKKQDIEYEQRRDFMEEFY